MSTPDTEHRGGNYGKYETEIKTGERYETGNCIASLNFCAELKIRMSRRTIF